MDIASPNVLKKIPFRVRIGVTGHRTLPNEDEIAKSVRTILEETIPSLLGKKSKSLRDKSPDVPIAYSVISPLAEGADRLVAKEVLKRDDGRLEAVLPMTQADYGRDFGENTDSLYEFRRLLGECRKPVLLRQDSLYENFHDEELRNERHKAYRNVGQYVVDNSDFFIAIWDGKPAAGPGGTAEIVAYAKEQARPVAVISTEKPYDLSILNSENLSVEAVGQIETFNRSLPPESQPRGDVDSRFGKFLSESWNDQFQPETVQIIRDRLDRLLPWHSIASSMARENQQRFQRAVWGIFSLSALAVGIVALGIIFFPHLAGYFFAAEFVVLAAILGIVWAGRRAGWHKRWIEARFLAERLRCAEFFATCGFEIPHHRVPPHMAMLHRIDDWMVRAFNEIWNRLPTMTGCKANECGSLARFIQERWIQSQIDYHEKNAQKLHRKHRLYEFWAIGMFAAALVAALLHAVSALLTDHSHTGLTGEALTFLAIALPAAGAAVGGISSQREYSRLEKRSQSMAFSLERIKKRFGQAESGTELERLLLEVDDIMSSETRDWLALMVFSEIRPPA